MQNKTSNFWLDDSLQYDVLTGQEITIGRDYHKIASTLRAITNFVNIVTGQSINVTYSTKDESYTDGTTVVLSSNIKDKDFDPTVGLALHEGSHIKLTNFKTLEKLMASTPYGMSVIPSKLLKLVVDQIKSVNLLGEQYATYNKAQLEMLATNYIVAKVKDLLNIVEDRRIDNFIYTTAPGYRGYYQAMYNKYFYSPIIDKGLASNEKRTEDWDSYFFRIVNITNQNRDLNALNGLVKVWKVLDLKNISRLKTTEQALAVAFEIFEIVQQEISSTNCDDSSKDDNGDKQKEEQEKQEPSGTSVSGKQEPSGNSLSDKQYDKLNKDIQKQKEFVSGNVHKKTMSKSDKNKVEAMQESGSEFKVVGNGLPSSRFGNIGKGTKCIVVPNITKNLIDSNIYETISTIGYWNYAKDDNIITSGIQLGTQLGKKLQIRNDENTLKYNRLAKGKIDKRMISSLGFGNTQVFEQVLLNRFKPTNLHISIDASGSMSGIKWNNTQISAIAIAKAASMVQNLNVVISYRSTEQVGGTNFPAIFIAYDSRKDKIAKIVQLFKYIKCPGTTPEGLCFEAIQALMIPGNETNDSYFINFSDGQPYFENNDIRYSGNNAELHTKKQVLKMRQKGIKVISYFIGSNIDYQCSTERYKASFSSMYGNDAQHINVNNLAQLAKSINTKFATKE